MSDHATTVQSGEMFAITSGEYSDWTLHGLFQAVGECDLEALRTRAGEAWLELNEWADGDLEFAGRQEIGEAMAVLAKRDAHTPLTIREAFLDYGRNIGEYAVRMGYLDGSEEGPE